VPWEHTKPALGPGGREGKSWPYKVLRVVTSKEKVKGVVDLILKACQPSLVLCFKFSCRDTTKVIET
jgi:hypothetical protein